MSANKDKSECGYNEFGRLRYFHGMLLDDKDFTAEQEYHNKKRRFLNRMLHGSGVVCGLEFNGKKDGQWIEVTSGLALDCSGNEIWVPRNTRIELATLLPPKDKGKNYSECEEEELPKPNTYYIGIRYEEKPSNPVSVYLPSGSCEERTCENSRYKEGFCIEVVPCCREKYDDGLLKKFCECPTEFQPKDDDLTLCSGCGGLQNQDLCKCLELEKFCEQSVPCPECCSCDKPCHVVLGKIEVNEKGRLVSACINECRSYVLTGRLLQHMLLGVFAGSENYFYMDVNGQKNYLPNVGELAHNPIKALCWFLQHTLIEKGTWTATDCGKEKERKDSPTLENQVTQMQAQMQIMMDTNSQLRAHIDRISEDTRGQQLRLEEVAKRVPTAEQPAATESPATPESPAATEGQAATEKPSTTKTPKSQKPS
jgi:hypothetical protein